MKYIKKYNRLEPSRDCLIHLIGDIGGYGLENNYVPPVLFKEMYLAKNMDKSNLEGIYEEISLDDLQSYKEKWQKELDERIAKEKEQEEKDKLLQDYYDIKKEAE